MGETKKTAETVTRIAEFQCTRTHYSKGFVPYGMEGETENVSGSEAVSNNAPVTIKVVPNESPAKTEDRFEKAAEIELRGMLFRKEMSDCSSHQFVRFSSTAQGALKAGPISADAMTAYGKAMDDCRKATGSYVMCKPQP